MAAYQVQDLEWIRGTTPTLIFRFSKAGEALTFDTAIISVFKAKALAWRAVMPRTDIDLGEVRYTVTAAQSRALAESKPGDVGKNSYEIELRNGPDERVYVIGTIAGIGGRNSDEGDVEEGIV